MFLFQSQLKRCRDKIEIIPSYLTNDLKYLFVRQLKDAFCLGANLQKKKIIKTNLLFFTCLTHSFIRFLRNLRHFTQKSQGESRRSSAKENFYFELCCPVVYQLIHRQEKSTAKSTQVVKFVEKNEFSLTVFKHFKLLEYCKCICIQNYFHIQLLFTYSNSENLS